MLLYLTMASRLGLEISFEDILSSPSSEPIGFASDDYKFSEVNFWKRKATSLEQTYQRTPKRKIILPSKSVPALSTPNILLGSTRNLEDIEDSHCAQSEDSTYSPGAQSQKPGRVSSDQMFFAFFESVLAEESAFWRLSNNLFIVNGWSMKETAPTEYWYHAQQVLTSTGKSIICLCPDAKKWTECFHVRFLREFGDEKFPRDHKDGSE